MTGVEKSKKRKSKKKTKTKEKVAAKEQVVEEQTDVLEKVMDSIEMAGASLDFFDQEPEATTTAETESEDVVEASSEDVEVIEEPHSEEEVVEASADDSVEESSEEIVIEEDAENLSLIEEENTDEFIDQSQAYSIIESLLFSSDRPLGLGTFKQIFKGTNYKTKDIKKALEEMESVYADASRGVTLEEINGGWQLRTKVDNMPFMRKLAKARPFKLSGPALEVLAIIAYKQPLVKSEVDQIRGVESGHLVRALMEKHLVCFQGKSELPGKPMQYGTTRKFLEIFGLRNLKELPSLDEIDQLLPDGIGAEEEDEKLSDVTENMSEDYEGNYSESEEELEKIADTLGSIDTSSEFFEQEKQRQKEKRDRDRAQDIREALDVGEEVEAKDQKWLARYDEKMAVLAAEAESAASEEIEASGEESSLDEETAQILDEDLNENSDNVLEFQATEDQEVVEEPSLENELSTLSEDYSDEVETIEASSVEEVSGDEDVEPLDEALSDGDDGEIDPFADDFE